MKPIYTDYFETRDDGSISLNVPENFNFAFDVVDRIAKEEPARRALVWEQDESCVLYSKTEEHTKEFSFEDMSKLSSMAANYLVSKGVRRGDRVMLIMKRHYTYWYILTALHKIGVIALPATFMLNHDDLIHRMHETNACAIVCIGEESICRKVKNAALESPSVHSLFCVGADAEGFVRIDKEIFSFPDTFERGETKRTDPLLLYFTSGTTGNPKIVLQDASYPLAHIQTALLWQNVRDRGLHLSVADTGWAKASWGKIYGQWLCGSAVMVYDYDTFSAVKLLKILNEHGVTTFCAPPTIYRFLVKNHLLDNGFAKVEYAATAGEAINAEIVEQFHELTGLEIHAGYGQTESALLVAEFVNSPVCPGAMGRPSPLYNPIIVDENGRECADEEPGEIVIPPAKRCNVGLCVPEAEGFNMGSSVWEGDLYHTGDIARRDKDGYFWFVGRVDDVIKSRGYRISPFEVESVLIKHPAVMECAVTGIPDEQRGFVVKATIVLREGFTPDRAMTNMLKDFVKNKTADYKVPRVISYVDKLPQTFSGKIRHVEIRNRDAKEAQNTKKSQ